MFEEGCPYIGMAAIFGKGIDHIAIFTLSNPLDALYENIVQLTLRLLKYFSAFGTLSCHAPNWILLS